MNTKKMILLLSAFYLLVCLVPVERVDAFEYAGQAWCCDTINYYVNPTNPSSACGDPLAGLWFQSRINTAAAAWNALGTRFQLVNVDTTSVGCVLNSSGICQGVADGQNTISMATNCSWADQSVIAYSTWWFWTGGDTAGCLFESDICFNDDVTWYHNVGPCSGSCYDLISVAEHEIGHWIASNHENDELALGYRPIMFWSYSFCEMRRTVTADDSALIDWAYDANGSIALPARTAIKHDHPPYDPPPPRQQCNSGQPCDSTIFCDSLLWDPCILVCPASDVVFTVTAMDSCGNPVCDLNGMALSFASCPAIPCPNEEPNWPLVYPDSCNPATGEHFFTVDASLTTCSSCEAQLLVGGAVCAQIPARFLDNDGDGCVTQLDFVGGRVCDDFNCDFASDPGDSAIWAAHQGHCCGGGGCPPGPPFCDSVTTDPCLVICPASDIVWTVNVKDSCGNPICDSSGTWLDFSSCPQAIPCPNEEPNWPLVYPDSCDPATGDHFFTVDAGLLSCVTCDVGLYVNSALCRSIQAKFLDVTGDLCVTAADWIPGGGCNDYNCDGIEGDAADLAIHTAHLGHCCNQAPCDPGPPFCDSVTIDPCLVICPASDIVWTATVKDSCGNPICDLTGTWLDFSDPNCPAIPCPGEEPDWPLVYPDSCDSATGVHYFTVDAGYMDPAMLCDCNPILFVGGQPCRTVPARFLDITGDLCVTDVDWGPIAPCNDYDCNGVIDAIDSLIHDAHLGHCCGQDPCPPGPPFCDSVTTDTCLVICPASDIVWTVTVKDSCGNPLCDPGTWLDFSNCEAIPCPGEEPNWPIVLPDSCNPSTGVHYFTVDAGLLGCVDCIAQLFVDGQYCRDIPAKFLDVTGDLCVTSADWLPGGPCNDYNCDGIPGDAADLAIHTAHLGHCCSEPCPPGPAFCDSIVTDPCLVICPLSDIVFSVWVADSCGNPICDSSGLWLNFDNCNAQPCPGEEPNWPNVYPDSCDPNTGQHFFTVDAGLLVGADPCPDCQALLFMSGQICKVIPARFLDIDGDLCVTPNDWLNSWPCNDYNCDGTITSADQAIHAAHLGHCCPQPCPPGPPFCDSTTTDPCLLVCPASDITFMVTVKDSCGNKLCDTAGTWLDFSGCSQAIPCPGEEPDWPLVFPDSCDTTSGVHYFTVDAGLGACVDCQADVYVDGQFCLTVPALFMDTNGDLCVDSTDWMGTAPCNDYNCDGAITTADSVIHADHLDHCCDPQGSIQGMKFNDLDCNGIHDAGEPPISGWAINLSQFGSQIAQTTTDGSGDYLFTGLCPGTYKVSEIVQQGWVQTFPPTVLYVVELGCGQTVTGLDFGNVVDTCSGIWSTVGQVDGTKDNFVGPEPSSPGADLIPLLNCVNGMNNWFDSPMSNKCFGHTFTGFWDTTCCILGGELCMKLKATGPYPYTDGIALAENGAYVWSLTLNDLQAFATGGLDTVWDSGDMMEICLDLENLPPSAGSGVTNVLAALKDGDFDVKFQDDTEIDYLELRVEVCCDTVPCDPGQPFCDSVTSDPCLLVCPASDIAFTVTVKDSCGNAVCDPAGTWLDFGSCNDAIPCPGEEPNWPEVFSDSCDTITGVHYFTVDAGIGGCVDCQVSVFVDGQFCLSVPAKFMDTNGDLCVDSTDWVGAVGPCNDYNCDGAITVADSIIHADHINHCCNADGSIQGHKFEDHNCNGVFDANETLLSGWTINLHQYGDLIASTTTDAFGSYSFSGLCPGQYWVSEVVDSGWVQTAPPTAAYFVDLGCGENVQNFDFGNKVDTCAQLLSTAFQVDGTKDDFFGPQPSSPGASLIPLLNCPLGMNNWFDSTMSNRCFGHTFTGFWDTTCCILGGQLCLKITATGVIPDTDWLVIAENGVQIWMISLNELQGIITGGADTIWSVGDTLETCLDLENLPPSANNGITNVVAALGDGDFDVKIQDDTEVDYLELRVELCCDCCNTDGIRGDINGDGSIDVADLSFIVDYLFNGGPPPPCFEEADVNGDGSIDVADLTYMVDYLFLGGPPPLPCP